MEVRPVSKKKLTLSIEEEVIEAARAFSHQNKTSISSLVARYLEALTSGPGGTSPVVGRLRGILREGSDREAYRRYLAEKYGP